MAAWGSRAASACPASTTRAASCDEPGHATNSSLHPAWSNLAVDFQTDWLPTMQPHAFPSHTSIHAARNSDRNMSPEKKTSIPPFFYAARELCPLAACGVAPGSDSASPRCCLQRSIRLPVPVCTQAGMYSMRRNTVLGLGHDCPGHNYLGHNDRYVLNAAQHHARAVRRQHQLATAVHATAVPGRRATVKNIKGPIANEPRIPCGCRLGAMPIATGSCP